MEPKAFEKESQQLKEFVADLEFEKLIFNENFDFLNAMSYGKSPLECVC